MAVTDEAGSCFSSKSSTTLDIIPGFRTQERICICTFIRNKTKSCIINVVNCLLFEQT